VSSSRSMGSSSTPTMFDKTISLLRDFTTSDLSVIYKVAKALASETD
jgi:hypothetical protein